MVNNQLITEKKAIKGGNNQALIYLPKKIFKPGDEVIIIKKESIESQHIVIEIKKGDTNEIPS